MTLSVPFSVLAFKRRRRAISCCHTYVHNLSTSSATMRTFNFLLYLWYHGMTILHSPNTHHHQLSPQKILAILTKFNIKMQILCNIHWITFLFSTMHLGCSNSERTTTMASFTRRAKAMLCIQTQRNWGYKTSAALWSNTRKNAQNDDDDRDDSIMISYF